MILNEKALRAFARSVLFQNYEMINEMHLGPDDIPHLKASNRSSGIYNGYIHFDRPGPIENIEEEENEDNVLGDGEENEK